MNPDERKFFKCSICGYSRFQQIYRFGLFSYRQNVMVCKDCGAVCLNPRWDEKNTRNITVRTIMGNASRP